MFNEKDILARLQAGEDADTIAKEMAAALNAAVDQKKKDDEAASIQKKKETEKMEALQSILNDIKDWLATYYDIDAVVLDATFDELDAETMYKEIQSSIKAIEGLSRLIDPKHNSLFSESDDIFNKFFTKMKW